MSEIVSIKARLSDGAIVDCSCKLLSDLDWKLVLSGPIVGSQEASGRDLFDALISLRLQLENNGVRLLCGGARRDVFPSGMSRDMGGGRKAYVTRLGSPAQNADLLDIFDYSVADSVGSVAEQQAFHEKWIASLRK